MARPTVYSPNWDHWVAPNCLRPPSRNRCYRCDRTGPVSIRSDPRPMIRSDGIVVVVVGVVAIVDSDDSGRLDVGNSSM